jgi:hypothetical protein
VNSSGKVEIYVGLVVPNHLGGKSLNYRICFGNSTEDCKNGLVSLFGNPGTPLDKKLPISSCHFNVREVLVSVWIELAHTIQNGGLDQFLFSQTFDNFLGV